MLAKLLIIARKDLQSELRGKEAINSAVSFALVILLIFSFAFEPSAEETRAIVGGLLWIVYAFAGTLILNRSFARELPNDCLDALIAAPLSGHALFLGKALASFVLLLAVELLCLPVFIIFYDVRLGDAAWPLLLVILMGTWALTMVGTFFSALTVNIRLREIMLPVLIYPIMIPALIAAISLTANLLDGIALLAPANLQWVRLLFAFDIIYTALGVALIDIVLVG